MGFLGQIRDGMLSLTEKAQAFISVVPSFVGFISPGEPIFTNWNAKTALKKAMTASHVIAACARFRAYELAQVPWIVQEKTATGKWTKVIDHPLERLIEFPNPKQTRFQVMARAIMNMDLAGNALLNKTRIDTSGLKELAKTRRTGKATVELWPVQTDTIKPVPDPKKFIASYKYDPGGGIEPEFLPPEDVVHLMHPDPDYPYWGLSLMQSAGKLVDTHISAIKHQHGSLANRLVKDGILSFKRYLTKKQYEDTRARFAEQNLGRDASRGPIILGEDVSYTPFTMTPAEFDYINSLRQVEEGIMMIFGCPPPLLQQLTNATYANVGEARLIFWLETGIPFLELIREDLNLSLMPEFGDLQKFRLMYDLSKVWSLRGILDKLATTGQKFFQMGVPFDDINERMDYGFQETPAGTIAFVQSSNVAVTDVPLIDVATGEERPEDGNVTGDDKPPSDENEGSSDEEQDSGKENGKTPPTGKNSIRGYRFASTKREGLPDLPKAVFHRVDGHEKLK